MKAGSSEALVHLIFVTAAEGPIPEWNSLKPRRQEYQRRMFAHPATALNDRNAVQI
jgi:hypothetical protein